MGCTIVLLKPLLFLGNFLLNLVGLGLIIVGVTLQVSYKDYAQLIETSSFFTAPILCIALGLIISLLGFLGCCGALKESCAMMNTYAFLLTSLLIVQLAGAGAAYLYRAEVGMGMQKGITRTMNSYKLNNANETDPSYKVITTAWDGLQSHAKCCGVNEYKDWFAAATVYAARDDVPRSCCLPADNSTAALPEEGCAADVKNMQTDQAGARIYTVGCWHRFADAVTAHKPMLLTAAVVAIAVQLFVVVLACCYASALTASQRKYGAK